MFSKAGFKGMILGAGLASLAATDLRAQTDAKIITGTVTDAVTHLPVADAEVMALSDRTLSASTDANGAFRLVIDAGTAVRKGLRADRPIGLSGSDLSFSTGHAGARVRITLHDLRGGKVATLQDGILAEGAYSLSAAPASLPAGIYLLRAQVGDQVHSFKLSTLAAHAAAGANAPRRTGSSSQTLAKSADLGENWISVYKAGYLRKNKEVMAYADAQAVTLDSLKPATTPLKVFGDTNIPQIDWAGAAIYSWDNTAVLSTDSTNKGFNGSVASMNDSSFSNAAWNGWAFHVAVLPNAIQPFVDLSPYLGGSLHLAVKGSAKNIGVTVGSANQGQGTAPLVDLGGQGYLPDNQWHELNIPLSAFAGTLDLSQVFVYCGFVEPSVNGGEFDPTAGYTVDEIYYVPKP